MTSWLWRARSEKEMVMFNRVSVWLCYVRTEQLQTASAIALGLQITVGCRMWVGSGEEKENS